MNERMDDKTPMTTAEFLEHMNKHHPGWDDPHVETEAEAAEAAYKHERLETWRKLRLLEDGW